MNPLNVAKGKLTKIGVGVAAAGPLLENFLAFSRGEEWQNLVTAAEGAVGSWAVLVGALVAAWGALRAAIGYGGQ